MKYIQIATKNVNKLQDFNAILDYYYQYNHQSATFKFITMPDYVPDVEETGSTYVENAIIKARNAINHSNDISIAAIGEDSGLEVFALGNKPGIYSARYSNTHGNDEQNVKKLLQELQSDTNRKALYRSVLVYMDKTTMQSPIICEGTLQGSIAYAPRGKTMFGYDKIFIPSECNPLKLTLSELRDTCKATLNLHRTKAMLSLISILNAR